MVYVLGHHICDTDHVQMAQAYPFSPNTVVLGIQRQPDPHAPFELPEPEYLEVPVAEASGRPSHSSYDRRDPEKHLLERSKVETSMRPSYTLDDIATYVHSHRCVY